MDTAYDIKRIREERRRSNRVPMELRVRCKDLSRQVAPQAAMTENISGGGMRIRTARPIKEGNRLECLLYFPDGADRVKMINKVVWAKKEGEGAFEIGLEHLNIEPRGKEKFIFFICETLLDYNMR